MKFFLYFLLLLWCITACAANPQITQTTQTTVVVSDPVPSATSSATSAQSCRQFVELGSQLGELANTHIIYQGENKSEGHQLWVLSLAERERIRLENYPGTVSGLGFLDDGIQILIAIGDGESVWLGDRFGSQPQKVKLTDELLASFQPYSPLWLEFVGYPNEIVSSPFSRYYSPNASTIAEWERGDQALILVDVASQDKIEVISTGLHDAITGIWLPDNEYFLFVHEHSEQEKYSSQILLVSDEGDELLEVTPKFDNFSFHTPVLSHDQKKVVFSASTGTDDFLGVLWLDTGEVHLFPLKNPIASSWQDSYVWSPDDKWIAFLSEDEQVDIQVLNIDSGETFCLTNDPLREILFDWE